METTTSSTSGTTPFKKLRKSFLAWYGIGAAPVGIGFIVNVYILYYYDQVLHVPVGLVTTALMIAAMFDAVTDPIVGAISDRTKSSLGRRHPYMFASAIPLGIVFYYTWAPPSNLDSYGLAVWLIVCLLIQRLLSTFYLVPHYAFGAEVTQDYDERTLVTSVRSYINTVGRSVAGAALLLYFLRNTPLYPDGKNNPNGYVEFALWFGLISSVCYLLSAVFTRKEGQALSAPDYQKLPLSEAMWLPFKDIKDALQYRAFRSLTGTVLLQQVAFGVAETLSMYMVTYFWKISHTMLFWWGTAMFTGMFIGYIFWRLISKRMEKKTVYIIGTIGYVVCATIPYVFKVVGIWPSADSAWYLSLYIGITGLLAHFLLAGPIIMTGSMLGDISDLDELNTGKRREGVIVGAESLAHKLFNSIGPPIAGIIVSIAGIGSTTKQLADAAQVSQSDANVLGLAQGVVVAMLFIGSYLFLRNYDLDVKKHQEIMDALAKK